MTLSGTPILTPAKHGNGILFANVVWNTGHAITLTSPESYCMENLTACEDGLSIAYWIKMHALNPGWPGTIRGVSVDIGCRSINATTTYRDTCWFK